MPRLAAALTFLFALALPAVAAEQNAYENLVTPLLSGSETVLGQPIAYPAGTAKIAAAIVTIPPGGETGWHTHSVPLYAYILDGALTVDYGSKGLKVYNTGDSVLEAMNWAHNGANKGTVPVRILAVYIGAEGVANADKADAPQ